MRKGQIHFLFLLHLLFILGCHPKKRSTEIVEIKQEWIEALSHHIDSVFGLKEDTNLDNFKVDSQQVEPIAKEVEPFVISSFKKTPCFGKCPVFEIRIYNTGRAIYNGERFTDKIGVYEAIVSPDSLQLIFESAQKSGYFELNDKYPINGEKIPDLPTTISFLKKDSFEKRIENNHDAPSELLIYESFFMEWANSLNWQKVGAK